MQKLWVNSADSHVLEPDDLWERSLPAALRPRAPRSERKDGRETVYVDGQVVRRDPLDFADAMRPPGALDHRIRLRDLDEQGIWGEVVFPSRGLWTAVMTDPVLAHECIKVYNDWLKSDFLSLSPRLVGAAMVSMLDTDDAVSELHRAAGLGYQTVFLAATPPPGREFNKEVWEPFWAAAAEARITVSIHIGTGADTVVTRGPGGAIANYVETLFPAQRAVTQLAASGVLDRHPDLRVLIAEAGCAWVPALADRMDEAYRQHGMFVRPKLSMLPSELVRRQVYASFQHDGTAIGAVTAMNYTNVLWGSDYPHLEGTFPRTQEVLTELFDGVDEEVRDLIIRDNFEKLFSVPKRQDA
ncbi:amidohydrolase family protein [Kitasatospora sp. NPDC101235]|uniref:amidohydrolase family protein n=1 Tax=Kitasatospora sp. NPDC101235 TaxID=3364101 RepID=UPI00380A2D9F